MNRKDRIDQVVTQADKLQTSERESALAWSRLCRELANMSEPQSRPPRFAGLLKTIWVAATNEQS